ncbi:MULTISPECIES: TRAP transporter small permease [Marinobacter]|uniref:TRAP transporter small permease protein n=1 Tax=Marinobacter xestospongiae TaxID=994319 RepID=A0ABU3W3L9_9GAMM|nr:MULTISPECIES: TRAP transporter small permease [Marinobacter]MCK7568198.1 TRAP transporter small permease [Marinobacter xestospongiae]MDV2081142.1 TRAP transporter small permease [Marinobacter xestospongiae]UDL06156.1 TRAP transporter small permease [Marinobacter sp. CA1]
MSSRPPKFRPDAWLATLALVAICGISLGNVIVRYATDASFAFTEEFSVFCLVVLTFAGAAVAARHNQHIRIELIEHYLPLWARKVVYVLQWLAGLVVLGIMTWYGSTFALQEYQWESLSPGLGLPNWIYVVWLPLLSVAIMIRMTQSLIDRLRGREAPEVVHES